MREAGCTLAQGLANWSRRRGMGSAVTVADLRDLGGHSGETWGFTLVDAASREDLVLRVAPVSGGERAVKELLHQAPLLQALHRGGAKVAAIREVSADPDLFGSAYMIVDRLPGQPLVMGPDAGASWLTGSDRQAAYEAAADELANIHAVDVSQLLVDWSVARSPTDEIALWTRAIEHAAEPDWMHEGLRLGDELRAEAPDSWTTGLCHGDYQTNNILFVMEADGPQVGGVVDWEIAHIGSLEHDLAWFLMMNDDQAWDPVELRGGVDLDAIRRRYEAAAGRRIENLPWYWALACYRIAAIAGNKIRLHRTGRKIDAAWERASSSMPFFFARAHALLADS
jgi:aminoglycoside phosphotransferase (APT) family kinase protein